MKNNLKELFVSYEQAVALRELGLIEKCFTEIEHKKVCKEQSKPNGCQLHNLHCGYPDCTIDRTKPPVGMPLKQQVFRWLSLQLNDKDIMIPVDYEAQDKLIDVLIDKLKTKHLLL